MRKTNRQFGLALMIAATFCATPPAKADIAKARLIQKGVTAFECSLFAAFMSPKGGEAESQRLFQVGYDSSMAFMEAFDAGNISEEEFREFVRLDVALNLKRLVPDPAFAIGRVYQDIRKFAADRVLYGRTAAGAIDYDNPRDDFDVEAAEARRYYDLAKCSLID